ncbi:MAG: NAD+ synthase [Desulfarculaceae bacterium]|nr:NAD+ synthase [Desulfarculaceae bacterium]MCF8071084.1 NAD+ synthase [Desulfarculaceae bacterium]MCF8100672.1 NAD+ synthase [Desulfarculaceae bacterium]MCF8118070.1 NAD+ synthase [Desulfarculaceae bacterium]
MRIAQAQINPKVGDISGNLELILDQARRAHQAGAHLVTFPELALTGYPPEDLLLKPRFLMDSMAAVKELAGKCPDINLVVGFADADPEQGTCYNAAAVISQNRVLAVYRKKELPNYGVFDEVRYFTPGTDCLLLELGGARLMLTICEDVWVPGDECEVCAREQQAQVVLNISASPFHAGKLDIRKDIVARFAAATGSYVFYNNLVGAQDELVFDGGSLCVSPLGQTLACAPRFVEDLQMVDLELPPAPELPSPPQRPMVKTVRLPLPAPEPGQPLAPACAPEMGYLAETYQALVLGTRDYVSKNGFKRVVLGLSGGIDSAFTAAVAVEALGAENVTGVTMPSQFTSNETRGDAELLADNLGIQLITVPVAHIYHIYLDELKDAFGPGAPGVEHENLQARIRGNILMALSNRFGWLVLTTGNKSETAVGYCTLYGDMAGGFAVIKDVPKTLVYELAAHVNQSAGRELIPASTIERPPSAELRPDQKDSDSLPPYEVLDPILKAYVEQDMVLDEIVALGHDFETVREIIRLVDINEYKRRQAPPGVKITPKAFGRDRRLPITNHYRPGFDRRP